MIDAVQRLGIAYHFEQEIEAALLQISCTDDDEDDNADLYTVSLRFRLLRQQGYPINPTRVLEKFKDEKGNFKDDLAGDVKGLLSLYEAAYYRVNGEQVLDEALEFAKTRLGPIAQLEDSPWADRVRHSLKWPILKGLPIRESRLFMSFYQQDDTHNEAILKLGKLDFNLGQKLHQHELKLLTKWWMDLDTSNTLPFARDRMIECYLWALGPLVEPDHTTGRIFLAKITALVSILDDIFDVHGTLDELESIVNVIERGRQVLLYGVCKERGNCYLLNQFTTKRHQFTPSPPKKKLLSIYELQVKELVRTYIKEARWYNKGYIPTMEEYVPNGYVSVGYPLGMTILCCGMGEAASEEVFQWLFNQPNPNIVVAGSSIVRLMDDIVSHEFEQERGHVASAVECYMKQYGVSKQEAHVGLNNLVEILWKDVNEDILQPLKAPLPVLTAIINLVRVMDLLYKDEDTYTNAKTFMKEVITSTLVEPVSI
ncbi:unnamed protein product [Linum tenue]|uniref:Uncharacterized protein n=1 Tax=Linum tenue TaxID=586396 RepID=A0AAV0NAF9_9ROSI|nr:unnamed protein product [Linum tenue]